MLKNGVFPGNLIISILIPIHKGSRVDIRNSNNYRAVTLGSIFGKILHSIIIRNQKEPIKQLLCSFNISLTSTIMCSTLVIETIQYIIGSNFPCMHYLLTHPRPLTDCVIVNCFVLSERDMCPLFRLLIFNMYCNQYIHVRLNDSLSDVFSMKNGVKQGAVLSPVLFTVYSDIMLQKLQRSGVGCQFDGVFAGAFGYADDIVSLSLQ